MSDSAWQEPEAEEMIGEHQRRDGLAGEEQTNCAPTRRSFCAGGSQFSSEMEPAASEFAWLHTRHSGLWFSWMEGWQASVGA